MSGLRKLLVLLAVVTFVGGGVGFAASLDVATQKIAVGGSTVDVPKTGVSVSQSAAGGAVNTARTTTATLTGGTSSTTANLTFTLYGPGTGCTGTVVGTAETIATSGADGDAYTSSARTPTVAGTYWWHAAFAGDATNDAATSCVSITVTAASAPSTKLRLASIELTGGTRDGNSSNWQAQLSVSVVDESGAPVDGVSVTGAWTAPNVSQNGCSPTAGSGTCSFLGNFNGGSNNGTPRTWTVTALSKAGYTYDSANNTVNKITCRRVDTANSAPTACDGAIK